MFNLGLKRVFETLFGSCLDQICILSHAINSSRRETVNVQSFCLLGRACLALRVTGSPFKRFPHHKKTTAKMFSLVLPLENARTRSSDGKAQVEVYRTDTHHRFSVTWMKLNRGVPRRIWTASGWPCDQKVCCINIYIILYLRIGFSYSFPVKCRNTFSYRFLSLV